MGWNTWNTFGKDINEKLVRETADVMASEGYLEAGYEYLVIDDIWLLKERDENGRLVPDPEKFPSGMKALADYVHSKGLKFGMYSCAGVRTCAGYPSSFDHEYDDARQFAEIGIDFLKYDFCNFPNYADNRNRYLTMSMALRSTGRDILFSACNWGRGEPWNWMRGIGAHMYRSTHDIFDFYSSFEDIMKSQMDNLNANAPGCFNDLDMLTVGMYGKGNVGGDNLCTFEEYRTQFTFWCMAASPLMLGADVRNIDPECKDLLLSKELIRVNQDSECRPMTQINGTAKNTPIFIKLLEGGEFAIGFFNLTEKNREMQVTFADLGVPYHSGIALELTDLHTGETLGLKRDDLRVDVAAHASKIYRAKPVRI